MNLNTRSNHQNKSPDQVTELETAELEPPLRTHNEADSRDAECEDSADDRPECGAGFGGSLREVPASRQDQDRVH